MYCCFHVLVQLFSLAELALGFRTAYTVRTASAPLSAAGPSALRLPRRGLGRALAYGTTSGAAAAPLLLIDLLLVAPWHSALGADALADLSLSTSGLRAMLPALLPALAPRSPPGAEGGRPKAEARRYQWLLGVRRKLRGNKAWRAGAATLAGTGQEWSQV